MAGLEELIIGHFVANPEESFVTSGLSSYERLLAHTCCMYNHLVSESKFITYQTSCLEALYKIASKGF